ncbi:MAG: histidine--tRNA ligase [Bacteroidota bacterium]
MIQKPSIPRGTRDFSPVEMNRRIFIFSTIRQVFERYGFMPVETPAMENIETLTGKYGDEGDQLLFKILNSRPYDAKDEKKEVMLEAFKTSLKKNINSPELTEKALRYDLTVPFARYVVQHRNDLVFPFKRYQIQPVWRADKPQKGRYREFYQCDVDVIGSNSLLNEVELVQIICDIFSKLKIKVQIKLNNRKLLSGIADYLGESERFLNITVALDKLNKIGAVKVMEELQQKGVAEYAVRKLEPILKLTGSNKNKQEFIKKILSANEQAMSGLNEIETVMKLVEKTGIKANIVFDLTLARGLNYYTGSIFEVIAEGIQIGSICGGGRYDDLTGIFGMPGISGVGVSFGADRIYDVMEQLNIFQESSIARTKLLFVNFGEAEVQFCLPVLRKVRESGINAEIYPDCVKMKKQISYADSNGIDFVAIVGEDEIKTNVITLKNMKTGEQRRIKPEEIVLSLKWES